MKNGIILVVSKKMDRNVRRNEKRSERKLIRIGRKARENLGLEREKVVELWPDGDTSKRVNRGLVLNIYHAYSADLKEIKKTMSEEDYLRVGFVTSETFNYLCGDIADNKVDNIWIADSIDDIIIGADPEFVLLNSKQFIYASHVQGLGHMGKLAHDGPLAELRPEPEISVDKFIENIKTILTNDEKVELIDKYTWYADPFFEPDTIEPCVYGIGGHIHIGTPRLILEGINDPDTKYSMFTVLHYILNYLLAIPFMIIEGAEKSVYRRRKSNYGRVSDFRTDRDRLEYRVVSGAWLKHPTIAKAVLGTAKAIAEAYYKYLERKGIAKAFTPIYTDTHTFLGDDMNLLPELAVSKEFGVDLGRDGLKPILEVHGELDDSLVKNILQKLKELPTYNKYNKYIDTFIELVNRGLKEKELRVTPYFKSAWKYNRKLKFAEETL